MSDSNLKCVKNCQPSTPNSISYQLTDEQRLKIMADISRDICGARDQIYRYGCVLPNSWSTYQKSYVPCIKQMQIMNRHLLTHKSFLSQTYETVKVGNVVGHAQQCVSDVGILEAERRKLFPSTSEAPTPPSPSPVRLGSAAPGGNRLANLKKQLGKALGILRGLISKKGRHARQDVKNRANGAVATGDKALGSTERRVVSDALGAVKRSIRELNAVLIPGRPPVRRPGGSTSQMPGGYGSEE